MPFTRRVQCDSQTNTYCWRKVSSTRERVCRVTETTKIHAHPAERRRNVDHEIPTVFELNASSADELREPKFVTGPVHGPRGISFDFGNITYRSNCQRQSDIGRPGRADCHYRDCNPNEQYSCIKRERSVRFFFRFRCGPCPTKYDVKTMARVVRSSSGLSCGEKHFSPIGNRVLYSTVRRFRYSPTKRYSRRKKRFLVKSQKTRIALLRLYIFFKRERTKRKRSGEKKLIKFTCWQENTHRRSALRHGPLK